MSSTSFFQFKAQKELFRAALTGDNIKLQKAIDSGALSIKKQQTT